MVEGKFAKNPNIRGKYPVLVNGKIKYETYPLEIGESLYVPIGCFTTAYARECTIRTSMAIRDYTLKNYGIDYYIYSDTDSIHMLDLPEEELKKFIDIDDFKLGAWKIESKFKRAKFLRQKCYLEEQIVPVEEYNKMLKNATDDEKRESIIKKHVYYKKENYYTCLNVTVAGLPKALGRYVNFDNFKIGFSILASDNTKEHKLTYKHVEGGVMLVDTDFTIK